MPVFPALSPLRRAAARASAALMLLALTGCARDPAPAAILDSACDLNGGACTVALGDGRMLSLAIDPRPIPLMAPLRIRAQITGAVAPPATLDFGGDEMDMGVNRRELTAGADGSLSGTGALPVCVTGAMRWRAELTLKWPDGPQAVRFRFTTP